MSHLSILPTMLTDLEDLAVALVAEGYAVQRHSTVETLGSGMVPVDLVASRGDRVCFAWRRPDQGERLELLSDLQREVWSAGSQLRLRSILRRYALMQALKSVHDRALVSID